MMVILPRNQADPQGTEAIEKKAMRDYRRRIKAATQFYIDAVDVVPVTIVTNAKTYTYQLDATLLQQLLDNAGRYADELLLEGGAFRPWFFEQYVEVATTRGVAQQIANMAAQSPAYKAARAPAILSEPHLRRMVLARARVFEEMKNLSQQVKTDMARILADGIGRGQSPQVIARTMRDQLGIEQFRADRIARTEVATALRRAKWDEADDAAALIGAESREMHYSALSPTTRATHAARHAKIYTRDQARMWWAQGANAINCKCTSVAVLVDKSGNPVAKGIIARAEAAKVKAEAKDYPWVKEQ